MMKYVELNIGSVDFIHKNMKSDIYEIYYISLDAQLNVD